MNFWERCLDPDCDLCKSSEGKPAAQTLGLKRDAGDWNTHLSSTQLKNESKFWNLDNFNKTETVPQPACVPPQLPVFSYLGQLYATVCSWKRQLFYTLKTLTYNLLESGLFSILSHLNLSFLKYRSIQLCLGYNFLVGKGGGGKRINQELIMHREESRGEFFKRPKGPA